MRRIAKVAALAVAALFLSAGTLSPPLGPRGGAGGSATATNYPVAWDYIADLTNLKLFTSTGGSTTYANCPDLFAAAFEPYNLVSGGVSNDDANLLIRGSCSVTNSQLNPTQYDADLDAAGAPVTGPYNVIAAMIPTAAYVNGLPVSDGSNISGVSRGLIQWDGVEISYSCTGQTIPTVMLQLGDAWMTGHDTGVSSQNSYGGFAVGPTQKGKVSLIASSDCDASAVAGTPLITGTAAPFTTATTTVQYWQQSYNRSRLDDLEVIAQRAAGDANDLGAFFSANNETSFPKVYATGGGTGVQFVNFNIGSIENSTFTSNHLNIVIGDPTHGSHVTWFVECVDKTRGVDDATKCSTNNGSVNGLTFNRVDAESSLNGPELTVFGMGTVSFVNSHLEMTPSNLDVEGYVVGAAVCSAGSRAGLVATTNGQCPSSGAVCPSSGGFGSNFTSLTFVNTSIGSETDSDTIGAFGVGECSQPGEINAYGGFWGYSRTGAGATDYALFTYDTVTLGVGNRPRFNLSSTAIANPALTPATYGYVATGNILQGTSNPTTTYYGQQADIFHNTATNEVKICVNTDGRCDTAVEWVTIIP